jgi:hypothetical protein
MAGSSPEERGPGPRLDVEQGLGQGRRENRILVAMVLNEQATGHRVGFDRAHPRSISERLHSLREKHGIPLPSTEAQANPPGQAMLDLGHRQSSLSHLRRLRMGAIAAPALVRHGRTTS